jgi:hypothetical protein
MGLTRIRAEQISDIDYKQAVRVITLADITLSGGAPATVDGISLLASDRVLVAGQTTGSQNGLYRVQTVGAGSNGTWVRTSDGNEDGEIEAGMIVMVTEGSVYKDTQWKLITNNPIVIGTTALVFEQNSAFAFGNIFANGTAVLANVVGDAVTFTAGNNIAITGNATAKSVTIGVTGISLNSISNGTSNVNVVSSGGNVTVGVGGTSNVAVFSTGGANVIGYVTATGNIAGGNLSVSTSVGSNLIPDADNTYSLGNATNRWSNLFLTGNTIQLGNLQLKDTGGTLQILQNDGANLAPISAATEASETAIFSDDADFGDVDEMVITSLDLGLITAEETVEINLGSLVQAGLLQPDLIVFPSYSVASLPPAFPEGQMVYVSNETGGAVMAFSDGTNWRRVTDRAVVT